MRRDGKTLTVLPEATPSLLLQLNSEEEAHHWERWLRKATRKGHPAAQMRNAWETVVLALILEGQ